MASATRFAQGEAILLPTARQPSAPLLLIRPNIGYITARFTLAFRLHQQIVTLAVFANRRIGAQVKPQRLSALSIGANGQNARQKIALAAGCSCEEDKKRNAPCNSSRR